jgi:peptidoglycan/LPS O-acetylase OafA/YrhL
VIEHRASGRLDFIDAVRGVAALMVLLQHGLEFAGYTDPASGFGRYVINFGQAGVAAFFLVSGFVIPLGLERWGSVKQFWIGRFARIYPLYICLLILNLVLLNQADFWHMGFSYAARLVVAHLLFVQDYLHFPGCVGAAWTLSVEMVWYSFFSILFACGLNKNASAVSVPIAVIVLVLSGYSIISGVRIPLGRFDLLLLCVAGLLFYRMFMGQINFGSFCLWSMGVVFVAAVGQSVSFGRFEHPELTLTAIIASWALGISIFLIAYICKEQKWMRWPLLLRAGSYSYSIYLVHPFIIDVLMRFHLTGWIGFVSLVVSTIIVSYLTFNFIESPIIELAARYRRRQSMLSPS